MYLLISDGTMDVAAAFYRVLAAEYACDGLRVGAMLLFEDAG
jgi:hypothetical protein